MGEFLLFLMPSMINCYRSKKEEDIQKTAGKKILNKKIKKYPSSGYVPFRNKRITKRTEMMFYFDFDHFFSLSIQTLSTSFRYTRKIVWFNSIMHRKKNKSQMESVEGIVTQVVHETISHEEWSFSPIWSMNETLQVILIFFKASE